MAIKLEQQWERHNDCMLEKGKQWEVDLYGFNPNGMGDLITRTATFAIALDDTELLMLCIMLCKERRRWPDWLEPGPVVRKLYKDKGFKPYRRQRGMTRDPYTMTLAALKLNTHIRDEEKPFWAQQVKLPWYCWRLNWHFWAQYIRTGRGWYLRAYEATKLPGMRWALRTGQWQERIRNKAKLFGITGPKWKARIYGKLASMDMFGLAGFAVHLTAWQAYTAGAEKVKRFILHECGVPSWNFVIKLLCGHRPMYLVADFIERYQACKGYEWEQWEQCKRPQDLIPLGETYKLPKDILTYLWQKYKTELYHDVRKQ